MRRITVSRTIETPAAAVWDVLVDTRRWSEWGSTVRSATVDGEGHRIASGSTGSVTTVVGVTLPFRITDWVDGTSWRWNVAGLPATGHRVDALGERRCRVSMDVPWFAAPYAAILRSALANIERLTTA